MVAARMRVDIECIKVASVDINVRVSATYDIAGRITGAEQELKKVRPARKAKLSGSRPIWIARLVHLRSGQERQAPSIELLYRSLPAHSSGSYQP